MGYVGNKVEIPLGELGLLTDISPDKIPPGALVRANNVCFYNGNVQKAPGTLKWNADPLIRAEDNNLTGIVAIHHWRPNLDKQYFMAVTDVGDIYKGQDRQFGSAINTTIASTLTPNCAFVEGGSEDANNNKKLFLFTNGATNPYVLSGEGTAFSTIAYPNEDWTVASAYPKCGVIHRGSLWAFAGQFSYASSTSNHEDFRNSSATFVDPVYPGEGGELRGAFVYKDKLFAFKDGGFVYALDEQYDSTGVVLRRWGKIGSNFGLAAPNAIAEVLDDMLAGNTSGTINSYAATQNLGNVEAADIIQNMQFESFLRANTNKVGVTEQHLLYYSEKKTLFATYRSHYRTSNDMLLMFDFGKKSQPRPAFWIKGSPQCLGSYRDINQVDRPMYGDAAGYLHLMDYEDRLEGQVIDRVRAIQHVTVSALLTTGTFTLTYAGATTAPIAYNATQTEIGDALTAVVGFYMNVLPALPISTGGFQNDITISFTFYGFNGPATELITGTSTEGKTFSAVDVVTGVYGSWDPAVAYTGEFQTPHYDFGWTGPGVGSAEKHFDFLSVHYVPEGAGNLSVDYFIDGRYIDTLTFPMIQYNCPELDTMVLDTDRLAQNNTEVCTRKLAGTGRTISFRAYNSGSNESFQVSKMTVFFRPGGDRAQKV